MSKSIPAKEGWTAHFIDEQNYIDFLLWQKHNKSEVMSKESIDEVIKNANKDNSIKEDIANILRDNIYFSGQLGNYVIHGAIEKIIEYFTKAGYSHRPESGDFSEMDKVIKCLALELPGQVWNDVNTKWQALKASHIKEVGITWTNVKDGLPERGSLVLTWSDGLGYRILPTDTSIKVLPYDVLFWYKLPHSPDESPANEAIEFEDWKDSYLNSPTGKNEAWKEPFKEWLNITLDLKLENGRKIELIIDHVDYYIKTPALSATTPKGANDVVNTS